MNSAALIADGYHARTDGLTSLAVVFGVVGVWLGFPLADPIIGLFITVVIFGIVWQSAKAVFTRLLDGVQPQTIDQIRHLAEHRTDIREVIDVRARWLGHQLVADLDIVVASDANVAEADRVAADFERELIDHISGLQSIQIRIKPTQPTGRAEAKQATASPTQSHA